jgi:hypothetical protein
LGLVTRAAHKLNTNNAYQTALQKAGAHHGWYLQQRRLTDAELEKGINSFRKQIDKHTQWINDPYLKIPDFNSLHPDRQINLIERKWPQDIQRQQTQAAILEGILQERRNGKTR